MAINWSKVLRALEESPGCVDEQQHDKFMNLVLTNRIMLKQDAFYYDNNVGMEDVWIQDTKMEHHSEMHKYALMQSKLWWNIKVDRYDNVHNARELVMKKFPYMSEDICNKLDNTKKLYNYRL